MVSPLRITLLLIAGLPILGLFLWHSGQVIEAEMRWIDAKISDPRYASALVNGCYEVMGVQPFSQPTSQQAADILDCLRWELKEIARMEGVALSDGVLDSLLEALRDQIWPA